MCNKRVKKYIGLLMQTIDKYKVRVHKLDTELQQQLANVYIHFPRKYTIYVFSLQNT